MERLETVEGVGTMQEIMEWKGGGWSCAVGEVGEATLLPLPLTLHSRVLVCEALSSLGPGYFRDHLTLHASAATGTLQVNRATFRLPREDDSQGPGMENALWTTLLKKITLPLLRSPQSV